MTDFVILLIRRQYPYLCLPLTLACITNALFSAKFLRFLIKKAEKYFEIRVFFVSIRIFFCTYIVKSVKLKFIFIHHLRKGYYHASDNRIHQQCR